MWSVLRCEVWVSGGRVCAVCASLVALLLADAYLPALVPLLPRGMRRAAELPLAAALAAWR